MNINLCELLKGHEGETFYSPIFGEVKLISVKSNNFNGYPIEIQCNNCFVKEFTKDGRYYKSFKGEIMIFPSKDQRDWNVWAEKQKTKIPKTWSQYKKSGYIEEFPAIGRHDKISNDVNFYSEECLSSIEKSALALLRIYYLIKAGYGGNITDEEWNNRQCFKHCISCVGNELSIAKKYSYRNLIAFHTKEQAEEFLSYPENVQLIKDFYQI